MGGLPDVADRGPADDRSMHRSLPTDHLRRAAWRWDLAAWLGVLLTVVWLVAIA